jgi:ribonucleoside-diphosphate reductase alpha chain/ribonucleoside-triphosphate reductase
MSITRLNTPLLTDKFINQYPDFPAHMTALGKFVYYRTYSRWLPEKRRREVWKETCRRAVEYNCSLAPTLREEAENFFNSMFNLGQFLSCRTLWVGGTEVAKKFPMSNFNCSFAVIDDFEAFKDMFYLLLVGTGFGFRILKSDIEHLPKVRQDVVLSHKYVAVSAKERQDETSLTFNKHMATITVGDSKEGWVQAMDFYFRILWDKDYRNITAIRIDYSNVRPKGERLKTFGGTASGHESLKAMFTKIHNVFTTDKYAPRPIDGKLRPIHCLDIANIIGENVVVGGVRRTSEIALGDPTDEEFITAKQNVTPEMGHRWMSNNSIFYEQKPSREQFKRQFDLLKLNGEPCFVNAEASKKRNPNYKGTNPCGEILLDHRGLCNLTTINAMHFINEQGWLDKEALFAAQRLSARAGLRMTCVDLELHKWDAVQKRDRLVGCSVTGWEDAMDAYGIPMFEVRKLKRQLKQIARESANAYADELGINRPLLVTTVKPEGTLSQVAGGVSSGLHYSHSPYYIRRIRINAHDPLCKAVEQLGWPVYNENGQGVILSDGTSVPVMTKVIEFPVKSPAKKTKYDVSALQQLQNYYSFQQDYTEHNSSNTISVKPEEWPEVEENIWNNWDDMVAVSFLQLTGHVYKQPPYEAITEEEYNRRISVMKPFDMGILKEIEDIGEDFDLGTEVCEAGACPIR